MKTTVIPKKIIEQSEINLQNLKPGTIVTLSDNSIKALVISGCKKRGDNYINSKNKLILLTNFDVDWFSEPGGWYNKPIKILGKLTEIFVEEI